MKNNIELWRYFQKQISKSEKSLVMKLIIVCVFYPPLKSLEELEKYPEVIEQMRQDSRKNFWKNR